MPDMFACLSYVFIMTITPGPNNMVCLVNATKFGFRRTLPFLSGLAVGVIVIMIGSSYLNLSLSRFIPSFRPIAEVFGGLYMTYLAVRILRSEGEAKGSQLMQTPVVQLSLWVSVCSLSMPN